jgi:hypothetical protein
MQLNKLSSNVNPFHYLVIIDRKQSGQTIFLKALARDLAKQTRLRGLFIHGDNERTEQLLQDGVMRHVARRRITKETSKRLVDIFAEAGVSCVAVELSQVSTKQSEGVVELDKRIEERIPGRTHLILSNLVDDEGKNMELDAMATYVSTVLEIPVLKINSPDINGIFVEKGEKNSDNEDMKTAQVQHLSIQDWGRFEEIYYPQND